MLKQWESVQVGINTIFLESFLLQDRFCAGDENAQNCCSTRFAAMFRDELYVFVGRITRQLTTSN